MRSHVSPAYEHIHSVYAPFPSCVGYHGIKDKSKVFCPCFPHRNRCRSHAASFLDDILDTLALLFSTVQNAKSEAWAEVPQRTANRYAPAVCSTCSLCSDRPQFLKSESTVHVGLRSVEHAIELLVEAIVDHYEQVAAVARAAGPNCFLGAAAAAEPQ